MSRRSKLVYLFSFNAILASAIVALVTMLATGGSAERVFTCGASSISAEGRGFVPINNTFESITEAEAFICHEVPSPQSTPGWRMENISASRNGSKYVSFASVTLDYARPDDPAADLRIEVSPFHIDKLGYGIVDKVEVMGSDADLIQGLDQSHFILQWEADGFSFFVETHITPDFGLPQLYDILNSIE
jgi:hypothetical protein